MSTPILILGESGSGKSSAMRHLDPSRTLLIQAVRKSLPWKLADHPGWARWDDEKKTGNIFVSDNAEMIATLMKGTKKKVIVIDDYQYILSNELLRRWQDKGFDKFSQVGYNGLNLFHIAASLPDDVHVYFMAHTMIDEDGITKVKTPGKLMSTYTVEGLFSMVLRAVIRDGQHFLATKNSGSDTVKSPVGMFSEELIPNDLALVEKAVVEFGWGGEVPSSLVVAK